MDEFPLELERNPNHDEIQALVSGLGGIAFLKNKQKGFIAVGAAPILVDNVWREGFIVNPRLKNKK